jgi:hypothetical protein
MSIRKSRSPQTSHRRVFLTQEDSLPFESFGSKGVDEIMNLGEELSGLKKKYDAVKQENIKKSLLLDLLKGQVLELRSTASNIENEMSSFRERSKEFENEIFNAEERLNQEFDLKRVYEHLLNRNKLEGKHLDIQVNRYTEGVRNAKLKMDLESEKARRAKDLKFNTKTQLKELKVNLEEDTKKHIAHISNLEKNIVHRREMLKKYDDRQKRKKEIVELAALQDRESHERDLREKININKILYDLLIEKEKKYKTAGQEVEKSFQDIKNKTGYTDPKEILNKFMNREKTHNRLIEEVEKAETTLNILQTEYYESRDKLKDFMLITNLEENPDEYLNHHKKIIEGQKNLEKFQEQRRKTEIVFNDLIKWVDKLMQNLEISSKTKKIPENFQLISEKIDQMTETAKKDFEVFSENIQKKKKKNTQEIMKEIYSPRKIDAKSMANE